MKNVLLFFTALAFFLTSCGNGGMAGGGNAGPMKTQMDSISYAVGQTWGGNFKQTSEDSDGEIKFNLEMVFQGIQEAEAGKGKFDDNQVRQLMQAISTMANEAAQKKQAEAGKKQAVEAEKNIAIGAAFLAENGKKEGVITTESGLQYKVTKEGTGPSPVATDKVKVHYHGTLIDGTVFDSSVDRGEPAEFFLNQVIKGWTEGIPLMKVGEKTTFYVPSDIAYGPQARGPKIPGNSTLIFDVELLEIVTPETK